MNNDNLSNLSGLVASIQRFSLHDGPGIRTSVFLKGCNLRCAWCHNPETIRPESEIMLDMDRCIHCGHCVEGCYSGARTVVGKTMTARQVICEVLQDKAYYCKDGGLTLTGGEPTLQPNFSDAILSLAEREDIGCAIETNLYAPWETLRKLADRCELVMCDLKLWDHALHRKYTGVGNALILENLQKLSIYGKRLLIRTPVIAGINDQDDCILSIAHFLGELKGIIAYELLPYHPLGLSKKIEGHEPQQRFDRPSREHLELLVALAGKYIDNVRISNIAVKKVGESE